MNSKIKVNPLIILYNRFRVLNPFGPSIPIRSVNDNVNPFFIIGSGRSGTTLLRSMLNQHSDIEIPPESYVLPIIYKRFTVYRKLPWPELVKLILGEFISHPHFHFWNLDISELYNKLENIQEKDQSLYKIINSVYELYAGKNNKNKVLWGDKTPLNTYYTDEIDIMFNKPKYIHLKRDGRDVAASMLKSNLADNLKAACDRWMEALRTADKINAKTPNRILDVEYANLVFQPEVELERICEFLSVTFQKEMLNHRKNLGSLGDNVFDHHGNLKNPISSNSIGSWKKAFNQEQVKWMEQYLGKMLRANGYLLNDTLEN